jgi:hypothetical protein
MMSSRNRATLLKAVDAPRPISADRAPILVSRISRPEVGGATSANCDLDGRRSVGWAIPVPNHHARRKRRKCEPPKRRAAHASPSLLKTAK